MSKLWPRLDVASARVLYSDLRRRSIRELVSRADTHHDRATYAATGGARVTSAEIYTLASELRRTANEYGYPLTGDDAARTQFDRAAAEELFLRAEMTTVEAAHHGVWNFLALVAAPDLVQWRWLESTNQERWICTDRTRHMFGRLWWQALTFASSDEQGRLDLQLLRALSDSELSEITERRSIAGNPRLARALARTLVNAPSDIGRRDLLRSIAPRLRRQLAFVDFSILTDDQLDDHLRTLLPIADSHSDSAWQTQSSPSRL